MDKNIFYIANNFLVETNASNLPLDVESIAKALGIFVLSLDEETMELGESIHLSDKMQDSPAFSLFSEEGNFIFCSPMLTYDQRQNYIAHELGHLKLHTRHYSGGILTPTSQQEAEADEFMRHIRAPLPVLAKMGLESAEEVEKYTHLDRYNATLAYEDLLTYKEQVSLQKEQFKTQRRTQKQIIRPRISHWIHLHKTLLSVCFAVISTVGVMLFVSAMRKLLCPVNETVSTFVPQIAAAEEVEADHTPAIPEENICFWTPSGRVYHIYRDCYHIKNSEVIQGTIQDAIAHNRLELCKTCKGR